MIPRFHPAKRGFALFRVPFILRLQGGRIERPAMQGFTNLGRGAMPVRFLFVGDHILEKAGGKPQGLFFRLLPVFRYFPHAGAFCAHCISFPVRLQVVLQGCRLRPDRAFPCFCGISSAMGGAHPDGCIFKKTAAAIRQSRPCPFETAGVFCVSCHIFPLLSVLLSEGP